MVVSTNLENDAGKPEDSLCNQMKPRRVNVLVVPTREDRPLRIQSRILIPLPVTFSVVPFISGEYLNLEFMERRAESLPITWLGWAVAKRRTVVHAENRDIKYPSYFPMEMASASRSKMSKLLGSWLTGYREVMLRCAPIRIKTLKVDGVIVLSVLRPKGMTGPPLDLRAHLGN